MGNTAAVGGNVISRHVKVDNSGNTFVTGYFTATADFDPGAGTANLTSAGGNDIFIARYDAAGNYVYAKALGGTGDDLSNGIAFDGSGNVYITGSFTGTADFNPGTGTVNLVSSGSNDIFIARYDASGGYVYAGRIGGTGADAGNSIAVDRSGNTFITGYFTGTADFNPGSGIVNLTSTGSTDIFVAGYNASGLYSYAKSVGGTSGDVGNSISVDGSNNAYITGSFALTSDFDPGAATVNLISAGGNDIFIAKYDPSGNYIYAKGLGGTSGDIGNALTVDGTGNAFITGSFAGTADFDPGAAVASLNTTGSTDIFVAGYNASGNYIFAKGIGSTSADIGYGIVADALNNIYVTGSFTGSADFDPGTGTSILTSAGNTDVFVARYDASGNYAFAKAMGGADSDAGNAIGIDASGTSRITGTFLGTSDFDPNAGTVNLSIGGTLTNAFVSTIDNAGTFVRAAQLGTYADIDLDDMGRSIATDASGNTFITGTFEGTVDFDPGAGIANLTSVGSFDVFIAKYDASGNYMYARSFGSTNREAGESITVDGSGNACITGAFYGSIDFDPGAGTAIRTSIGSRDIFVAKFDASGNYVYAISMGSADADVGFGIAVDGTGNAYITGYFVNTVDFDPGPGTANLSSNAATDDIFIAKYDVSGNYIYAKSMGGASGDFGRGIAVDGSGNVYVTGYFNITADFDPGPGTANLVSAGITDVFLARYDASGNYVYAIRMGGTGTEYTYGVALDGLNNAYITGNFNGTSDFDPGPGTVNLTSAGGDDIFLAGYDALGNYIYAKAIGGINDEISFGIDADVAGNAYITGWFFATVDFDPNPGIANITSAGNSDLFVAKYDASGNYVYAKGIGGAGRELGFGIVVDGSNNTYLTGYFTGNSNFNPGGSPNSMITSSNSEDLFFAKYGPSASLPVDLISFVAKSVDNKDAVKLSWTTASQTNNEYFEIERSKDGKSFHPILKMQGCSTCTGIRQYELQDDTPYPGVSFYRLKQVDYDHQYSYSQVVAVNTVMRLRTILQAYPNITHDAFTIRIRNNTAKKQVLIQLLNEEGKLLRQQISWLSEGDNTFNYALANNAPGVYYIKLTDTNNRTAATAKIIKR